jgi:hypothetical protein
MKPQIEQLTVGGDPAAWRRAGFTVGAGGMQVGTVRLHFAPGEGILGSGAGADHARARGHMREGAGLGLPVALISAAG